MPYTGITFAAAKQQLAERLNDAGKVWTTDAELGLHVQDALRFWNILTGENRVNYPLSVTSNPVWYDLHTISGSPRFCSLTDRVCYLRLTYALLESPSSTAALTTLQFSQDDVVQAVQRKRDEFLFKTNCTSTINTRPLNAGMSNIGLPQQVIEARRAYWIPNTIPGVVSNPFPLFRNDEYATAAYSPFSPLNSSQPVAFSAGVIPPLTVEILPPPLVPGNVEFITIQTQPALSPSAATTLLIPQDFMPALVWGALADLLSMNMTAQDAARAAIARQRFEEYVSLMSVYPGVMAARVNGQAVFVDAVETLDVYNPTWRASTANPRMVGLSGQNLVAFPSPGAMQIILFMVGNASLPAVDADFIQLDASVIDAVLDEAQSVSSFKMGGAEAASAAGLHANIIKMAMQKNDKLKSLACFKEVLFGRVTRERDFAPAEVTSDNAG